MKFVQRLLPILFAFGLSGSMVNAQNDAGKTEDLGRIVLNAFVSDQVEGLPPAAKNILANKLSQIATQNGLGGSALNQRFIITPNITVLTRDITATAPPMHALTLDVTLYIGDGLEGTKFSSTSFEVKGVGTNESKAYIEALKQIKPANPQIQQCIESGKAKILEYYNTRCDFIIKEAQTLEAQQQYEAAILKLTSVPEVCKQCFDKCMDAVAPVYQKAIDRQCTLKLTEATNAWSIAQDANGATTSIEILKGIDPNAACFSKALDLSKTIAKRMKEIDQREWAFQLKEQQQTSERIKAIRDIGVAYGNGQPKSVTYNVRGWW
jgi:hypothetical protein